MRGRSIFWWRLLTASFDAAALTVALGGAALLRFGPETALDYAGAEALTLAAPWALSVGVFLASMGVFGLYSPTRCANGVEEARRLVSACFAAPSAIVLISFLMHATPSRMWIATGTLGALALTATGRRSARWTVGRLRRRGHFVTPSVLVGGLEAKMLVDTLTLEPAWGCVPVATCGFTYGELPSFALEELERAVGETEAKGVVVVAGELSRREIAEAVAVADDLRVGTMVVPGLDYMLLHNLQLVSLGAEPALALEQPSLRAHQRFLKRSVDVVGSALGLIALAPALAVIAAAIKLDSKGPVFFRQERVGLRGKPFVVWKFRTMVAGAHEKRVDYEEQNEAEGTLFKIKADPRITRVGRCLRKLSLDEVPQLANVLGGEMSLVGPRPALPEEADTYESNVRRRLNARPGITGLWQINGRSDLSYEEYVRLDLTYVRNWGVLLDAYILLRTIPVVIRAKGAY